MKSAGFMKLKTILKLKSKRKNDAIQKLFFVFLITSVLALGCRINVSRILGCVLVDPDLMNPRSKDVFDSGLDPELVFRYSWAEERTDSVQGLEVEYRLEFGGEGVSDL